MVEPELEAEQAWVRHIRETAIDISQFQRECTPSYFNNEGETQLDSEGKEKSRWYLGESYGPGWDAFQALLEDWRAEGEMRGLALSQPPREKGGTQHAAPESPESPGSARVRAQ